jgi:hypothetical protein
MKSNHIPKFQWPILLFFLVSNAVLSQENNTEETTLESEQYCSYFAESDPKSKLVTSHSNKNSEDVIDQIVKYTGINKNFSLKSSTDIDNARAVIRGEIRYIIFNLKFINRLKKKANNDWVVASVMAHELGHHLQGHTLGSSGSRAELELEADRYSGFILQKMGASLVDAQSAMASDGASEATITHPAKNDRLTAISNGWYLAQELDIPKSHGKKPDKDHLAIKEFTEDKTLDGNKAKLSYEADEEAKNDKDMEDDIKYVARLVFDENPLDDYYITDSNDIIGFNDFEEPVLMGEIEDTDNEGFVYMFHLNHINYYVDFEGFIFKQNKDHEMEEVGYVTDEE